MDAALGYPTTNPHGAPIPARDGTMAQTARVCLTEVGPGQSATIAEVSDHDPELLRYMGTLGFYPGAVVYLVAVTPFDGTLRVRVGTDEWTLGRQVASHIFVTGATKPALPQPERFLSGDR